jgi:hypothetical protein
MILTGARFTIHQEMNVDVLELLRYCYAAYTYGYYVLAAVLAYLAWLLALRIASIVMRPVGWIARGLGITRPLPKQATQQKRHSTDDHLEMIAHELQTTNKHLEELVLALQRTTKFT